MSRSKWLISFVIDLSTYERLLERSTGDTNNVAIMTDKVLNAADTPEHSRLRNEYKAVLDGMRGEISVIKGVHADIVESFNDYRLLKETDGQGRHKRKVFGFLGDLMSDVFDIAKNAEISSIQRNVYKLAAYQDTLMHVVEESLSILNVSRMETRENRQRINDLLMLIGSVEDKVINMSNHLEQEIREARTIVVLFSRLNTLIGELKLALSRSMYFYVNFQIQAVAMQKPSPRTIPAERLGNMLLEIKDKLPQTPIQEFSSGGVQVSPTKKSSDVFFFFLVLSLFYRSQLVNFKDIYHFSRFQRGSNIFQGGSNFFQGGGGPIAYSL